MTKNVYYLTWMTNGVKHYDGWYETREDAEFAMMHHERVYGGAYFIERKTIAD